MDFSRNKVLLKSDNKKIIFVGVIFTLFALAVVQLVYYYNGLTIDNPDTNLAARNIETPYKLWLNGYLGLFFGFNYLGNINWLILPLSLIYFIQNRASIKREHWAMVVLFAFSFLLISLKGFFNPRYAFTLLSLCLFLIFTLLYKLVKPYGVRVFNISTAILFLFIGYNFQNAIGTVRFQEKIEEFFSSKEADKTGTKQNIVEVKNLVVDLLDEIQKGKIGEVFLVNNLPDFYYQTDKKGLYYWAGNDDYYTSTGIQKLFEKYTSDDLKTFLFEKECFHIYTHESYFGYNDVFDNFLKNECELVLTDLENRQLYRIRNG